jgi:hypothetical protein
MVGPWRFADWSLAFQDRAAVLRATKRVTKWPGKIGPYSTSDKNRRVGENLKGEEKREVVANRLFHLRIRKSGAPFLKTSGTTGHLILLETKFLV